MTGYARQHQCHWPKSSCWNYLDVCGRDICIHLWLGENWWQLGWCHHAQPRIRTFGQSRDNVFMRLAAVQPSACIGELSRLKKGLKYLKHAEELDAFDVFELILWIIWIYSIKGTLLWSVFSTDVRPVFGYLGFSIEASGLPQDAFGPMGKQVREVMRCQMMPRAVKSWRQVAQKMLKM